MNVVKDDIIECGKYFIHGLNSGYQVDTINGQEKVQKFYNVLICDSANIDKATWSVWDRVWKDTEKQDRHRILLFAYGPAILDSFEYAVIIADNADTHSADVYEFRELIKKIKP